METPDPNALRVGFVPGVTMTKWRRRWDERLTQTLEVIEVDQTDAGPALGENRVDLCFVRLPIDRDGLHAIPLYDETMVAWVAKEHPIAAFDEITMADLADETVLDAIDAVAFDRVNAGAVLLVPMSVARSASRRDLVHRPVTDAPVSSVALTWRIGNEHPLIEEFIGIVRGRTANSSRTAQERAATGTRPPAEKKTAGTTRSGRTRAASRPPSGGRRRGRR